MTINLRKAIRRSLRPAPAMPQNQLVMIGQESLSRARMLCMQGHQDEAEGVIREAAQNRQALVVTNLTVPNCKAPPIGKAATCELRQLAEQARERALQGLRPWLAARRHRPEDNERDETRGLPFWLPHLPGDDPKP